MANIDIIIPTYNERENIGPLLDRIHAAIARASDRFSVLVVDDDSPDGTAEEVERLSKRYNCNVRVLRRAATARGLAVSVIDGIHATDGDAIVIMDADMSHPPHSVPRLVRPILDDEADFVVGSRYVPGGETRNWPLKRLWCSRLACALARPLVGFCDTTSGFFAVRRSLLPKLPLDPIGYKICLELAVKGKYRLIEIPITFKDRVRGQSKFGIRELLRYGSHLHRLYEFRWPQLTQFVKFGVVGSFGVVVDLLVLTIFVSFIGLPFGSARPLAFLSAMTANFAVNRVWTFRIVEGSLIRQYAKYAVASLAGLSVNWAVSVGLYSTFEALRSHYQIAAIGGVLASFVVNFLLVRTLVFGAGKRFGTHRHEERSVTPEMRSR